MVTLIILLGLVNYITTEIVVDSEIFRPYREWVRNHYAASMEREIVDGAFAEAFAGRNDVTAEEINVAMQSVRGSKFWREVAYFSQCKMCSGTWIAAIEVAVAGPLVLHGWTGYVAGALAVKAVGHLVLDFAYLLKGSHK